MNEPLEASDPSIAAKPVVKFEDYVRRHPGGALLVAAGVGLAAVLLSRAFAPPPPRNRVVQQLEEIQHRLASMARHGLDQASTLAQGGAHAVGKGIDNLGALQLGRQFDKISRALKSLFH